MGQRGGFDGKGHLTIGGRPRWILGVYDSGGGYFNDAASWERQIFAERNLQDIPINVYLNYWMGAVPWPQTKVLLDVLQRHGVMYLQTGNAFEGGSWRRPTLAAPFSIGDEAYVRAFAQHPAALGYYIADEPWDTLLAETIEHRQQLKSWDPDGVTFAALMAGFPSGQAVRTDPARVILDSNRNPVGSWSDAADILGVDPYPMYGREPATGYTHFSVADYISKLRAAAPASRPVWGVLQFFRGSSESRLATADELRTQAIMAIVEGVQGVFWWDIGVNGMRRESGAVVAEQMANLKGLVAELASLEPALLADNVNHLLVNSTTYPDPIVGRIVQLQHNDAVEWLYSRKEWYREEIAALLQGDRSKSGGMLQGAASIRTRAMIAEGRGYVFAYNYTNAQQPVRFTVPGLPPFSWSDSLEPYGARIYVISVESTGLVIRENRTRQKYPLGGGPPPPPPPPPPPTATFTVKFMYPAEGARVSGSLGPVINTTAPWEKPKTFALAVDDAPVASLPAPNGVSWLPSWNSRTVPNGPHVLKAMVTVGDQAAVATLRVEVAN